jgi:hypothetical protein
MPARIKALPINEKGYPVPYFVGYVDGRPDFRVVDPAKMRKCVRQRLCWVCGEKLGKFKAFTVGPMCAINRISGEPPSHRECAEWSAQACPFLTLPKAVRRSTDDLAGQISQPAGCHQDRNPGVTLIWVTDGYRMVRAPGGFLFEMNEPSETIWYTQSRIATHEEVVIAMKAGAEVLVDMADQEADPQAARDELRKVYLRALRYIPKLEAVHG